MDVSATLSKLELQRGKSTLMICFSIVLEQHDQDMRHIGASSMPSN